MKKFLIALAKYGLLFLLVSNGIALLSLLALERSNFYKPEFVKNGLTSKNYDYAVLGSSTGLTTLDTKEIDSITGKNGINISMDDSAISSHYLMLQHFLAHGNHTKTLILTITPWNTEVAEPEINGNDYRFLPFIYTDYVYNYYSTLEKSFFKPLTLSRYFPIVGVAYYNTELFYPSVVAALQPKKRNRFDYKGNYSYPSGNHPKQHEKVIQQFKSVNPYMDKIEDLCSKNNIKLLYYITPIYQTSVIPMDKNRAYINHADLLQTPDLFYDDMHVNAAGRLVCSAAVAKLLFQNN